MTYLCFAIARKFKGYTVEMAEQLPLNRLAEFAEWFEREAEANRQAIEDAKKGR